MPRRNPLRWIPDLADWFELRGVYVPGEDTRGVQPWREFGWMFVGWLIILGMFVLLFAFAS